MIHKLIIHCESELNDVLSISEPVNMLIVQNKLISPIDPKNVLITLVEDKTNTLTTPKEVFDFQTLS